MTTNEDAAVEAQEVDKDAFPELEVSDAAREGDVTPPMQAVDGPPYVYPPGDANAPHADTEWPEEGEAFHRRAKAADSRDLGEKYGQREAQARRYIKEDA